MKGLMKLVDFVEDYVFVDVEVQTLASQPHYLNCLAYLDADAKIVDDFAKSPKNEIVVKRLSSLVLTRIKIICNLL